jgi:hypothetical protein
MNRDKSELLKCCGNAFQCFVRKFLLLESLLFCKKLNTQSRHREEHAVKLLFFSNVTCSYLMKRNFNQLSCSGKDYYVV